MSSDFERLLRDARRALPKPDELTTQRVRERALAAARRRRLRGPAVAILAAALVAVGIGIGALVSPSGRAAPTLTGLGFLPAPGWSVLQNGGRGTPVRPAVAIAANVELSPDDDPDGLPLSTLETLPPDGVVIIASFIARGEPYFDRLFEARELPLSVAEAERMGYGVQLRPDRPLGQYELEGAVNGYNVELNIYYGTPRPTARALAAAQAQLDRLVIQPGRPAKVPASRALSTAPAAGRIVDRTLRCSSVSDGGSRFLRISMTSPKPTARPPVPASFGAWTGTDLGGESVVGLYAGPVFGRATGEIFYGRRRCQLTASVVPLTARGLPGPPVTFDQYARCPVGVRVLMRVRAVLDRAVAWRSSAELLTARGNVSSAAVAIRTETGRPLAYFTLGSGRTRFWQSGRCS